MTDQKKIREALDDCDNKQIEDWHEHTGSTIRQILESALQEKPRSDEVERAIGHLELILHSPKNDDGTPWINGGMSTVEEIVNKAISCLRNSQPAHNAGEGK